MNRFREADAAINKIIKSFLKNEALNETILLYSRFLTISNALNLRSFADTRDN